MADQKKELYIRVNGQLVEVTQDVYLTFYRMKRRERFVVEKDQRAGVVLYSDLDTDELVGEDMLPDYSHNVEEEAIANVMHSKLHNFLACLPEQDQRLLQALYFDGLTERQTGILLGMAQKTVNDRKHKALKKLRTMFGVK